MQPKSAISALSNKVFFLLVISLCARQAVGQELRKSIIRPIPVYPEVAKRLNLEGTVRIEAVVGPDGQIKRDEGDRRASGPCRISLEGSA